VKWLILLAAVLLAVLDHGLMAEPTTKPTTQPAEVRFITTIGSQLIGDTEKIVVTEEKDGRIQFRIRGTGPTEPQIKDRTRWFIAVVSPDDVWVHLGDGRLFRYTFAPANIRADEYQFPNIPIHNFPDAIRQKLREQMHSK
jgi:hypothetical protein